MMTTTPITRAQAEALTALVHALRPDWDGNGVMTALANARDRGTAWELAHAALHAAETPTNRTPAVIGMTGEHWTRGKPLGTATTTGRFQRCPEPGHSSYPAWNCGYCKAERLEATEQDRTLARQGVPPKRIREIRATATQPHPTERTDS